MVEEEATGFKLGDNEVGLDVGLVVGFLLGLLVIDLLVGCGVVGDNEGLVIGADVDGTDVNGAIDDDIDE